ncbi:hypothetical protein [Pandoraea pulmonicola]|nr:hypothetical protein [Pandoraea pulmonicola]
MHGQIVHGCEYEEGNYAVRDVGAICSANPAATQTARKNKDE